jgi:hypothetical protein
MSAGNRHAEEENVMKKQVTLYQDKVTKNTVRYTERKDQWPMQIYLQQSELTKPFPEQIFVSISTSQPA